MHRRTTRKQERKLGRLAAIGAFATAATFGVLVAVALSLTEARVKPPLQNPFDASRTIQ